MPSGVVGNTPDFDSGIPGSIPGLAAKLQKIIVDMMA